jgi:hypothetical protein
MSISQLGFKAIATCGGSGLNKFKTKLKAIGWKPNFIISMDNDEDESKGAKAAKDLAKLFTEQKLKFILSNVSGKCKDPNELLMSDPAELKRNLESARSEFVQTKTRMGKLMNMKTLEATKFPPREWFIKDLMSNGLYMLVAPPKMGKSFLALDMCLSIANGTPCLGYETVKHGVLYMVLEDRYSDFKERAKTILGGKEFPSNMEICDSDEFRLKEVKDGESLVDPSCSYRPKRTSLCGIGCLFQQCSCMGSRRQNHRRRWRKACGNYYTGAN